MPQLDQVDVKDHWEMQMFSISSDVNLLKYPPNAHTLSSMKTLTAWPCCQPGRACLSWNGLFITPVPNCGNKLYVIRVFVKHNEVIYPSVCKICLCEKHAVNAVSSSGSRAETCLRQRPFWLQEARTSKLFVVLLCGTQLLEQFHVFGQGQYQRSPILIVIKIVVAHGRPLSHVVASLLACHLTKTTPRGNCGLPKFDRERCRRVRRALCPFIELKVKLRLSLVWNAEATDSDKSKPSNRSKQTTSHSHHSH